MSKSVLRVARGALMASEAALAPHGSRYSRHDYTQPQLFALLVLRHFLRTDYRGVVALAAEWRELREALGRNRDIRNRGHDTKKPGTRYEETGDTIRRNRGHDTR